MICVNKQEKALFIRRHTEYRRMVANWWLSISTCTSHFLGRVSSVGIANRYGLDGPGIETQFGGEGFRTPPDLP
jgi:hypothetical protein